MPTRFARRLEVVRQRITELEQTVSATVVVCTEEREELRELYAEAAFLESMAA